MYSNTTSSVKLNNIFTKWFDTTTGATLFNILLNDLITDLEQFSVIDTDYFSLSVLCYTEDIVILCDSEEKITISAKSCSWMVFEVVFESEYK